MILSLSPLLQIVAAQTLNHICCKAPARVQEVISANALPVLMKIVSTSDHPHVIDQINWILGI